MSGERRMTTTAPPKNIPVLNRQDTEKFEKLLDELRQTDRRLEKLVQITATQRPSRPAEFLISDRTLK
jgi:hypothetical protein